MTLANDLEDAWITVAKLPPERRTDTLGSLPPRLWEKLRIALQAEYRQATGEPNATLTVTDSAAYGTRIAELEAEVERLRAGPKIKPLEWLEYERGPGFYAHSFLGRYSAWEQSGVGHWNAQGIITQTVPGGLEAAKAAAQADYEARVLSALVQP